MYQPRTYRHWVKGKELVSFTVTVNETDLFIRARKNLSGKALRIIEKYRESLEGYIKRFPEFRTSYEPVKVGDDAPRIVRSMAEAGEKAGVGPMAAVAGAIAEYVGRELLEYSPEIIVENGGDIYIRSLETRTVSIYAGDSPLSGKVGIRVEAGETPLGICTSSGTVGHSKSFGRADAVVVLSPSTALADAAATAIGNVVKGPETMQAGIEKAETIEGITGLLIIEGGLVGAWGSIKLCRTEY